MASSFADLPPDLFDRTTLVSLAATIVLVLVAYTLSVVLLRRPVGAPLRFLFIWHLSDALCHFVLEGSFLYHCFFSYVPVADIVSRGGTRALAEWYPTPFNFLGTEGRIYGPQAGGDGFFAQLWMVYARADKRWAGVDLVSSDTFCPPPWAAGSWSIELTNHVVGCCKPGASDRLL